MKKDTRARHALLLGLCFSTLVGCTEHVSIVRPLNISKAGEEARANFTVRERGDYKFALLFVAKRLNVELPALPQLERRRQLLGTLDSPGVPIPVRLEIVKNREVFLTENIISTGAGWGRAVEYNGVKKFAEVRLVRFADLFPGEYSVSMKILNDVGAFEGVEGFAEFTYYNPKI